MVGNSYIVLFVILYQLVFSLESLIKSASDCKRYPCLIFNDDFHTFDHATWQHLITTAPTGNEEFQYYTNNRSNSFVDDGVLYLKPTLTNDTFDDEFLSAGILDVWGTSPFTQCTANNYHGCRRIGSKSKIINPIQSAAVRSVNSFSFKYGKLEVRAKCPRGDWLWPAVWLMPKYNAYGDWPSSGEIDLLESRGNDVLHDDDQNKTLVGNQRVSQSLHWGPYYPLNGHPKTIGRTNLKEGSFADDFHTFGLVWSSNGIRFYIDNETTLNVSMNNMNFWDYGKFSDLNPNADNPWKSGTNMAPFDQEFFIIMNLAVGGTNQYFHENFSPTIPWTNSPSSNTNQSAMSEFWDARDQWLPTWNGNHAAFKIDHIKVWKLQP